MKTVNEYYRDVDSEIEREVSFESTALASAKCRTIFEKHLKLAMKDAAEDMRERAAKLVYDSSWCRVAAQEIRKLATGVK